MWKSARPRYQNKSEEETGSLSEKHQQVIRVLSLLAMEGHLDTSRGGRGRPPRDRLTLARAQRTQAERLMGHISRDATAIAARERVVKSEAPVPIAAPARINFIWMWRMAKSQSAPCCFHLVLYIAKVLAGAENHMPIRFSAIAALDFCNYLRSQNAGVS